jgi:hypothetical protein
MDYMFLGINVSWYKGVFIRFFRLYSCYISARKDPLACACENLSLVVLSLFICLSDVNDAGF